MDDYVRQLNRILNRTVTHSRVQILPTSTDPAQAEIARVQSRAFRPVEFVGGSWLWLNQRVRADVPTERVVIISYRYIYIVGPNPNDERNWIFRYEHSESNPLNYPYDPSHVHVNVDEMGSQVVGKTFKKLHFPTGFVRLEQILLHLILEWDLPILGDGQLPDARKQAVTALRESLAQARDIQAGR